MLVITHPYLALGLAIGWVCIVIAMYIAGSRGGRNPKHRDSTWALIKYVFDVDNKMMPWETALGLLYWTATLVVIIVAPVPISWRLWMVPLSIGVCFCTFPPALGLPVKILTSIGGDPEQLRKARAEQEERKAAKTRAKETKQQAAWDRRQEKLKNRDRKPNADR